MKQIFDILLRMYPRDYQAMFAPEMSGAFEEAWEERREQRWSAYVPFAIIELTGLASGAVIEWLAKLTTDRSIRGRTLPDRLLMRPPGVSWDAHYAGAFLVIPKREPARCAKS